MDQDQPASPSATLQSLVSRLRGVLARVLGASAGGICCVLASQGGSSRSILLRRCAAVPGVDGPRRRRRERGEAAAAAAELTEALALWRGAALVDLVAAGYLTAPATRLDEARLDAVEDLAELELATGRPADALSRLEGHVEVNSLRERGWALLMVALYRLGRQAVALRVFQRVRAILAEELGIEPSPELREIERRILRHDPTLPGDAVPASGGLGPWTPPPMERREPIDTVSHPPGARRGARRVRRLLGHRGGGPRLPAPHRGSAAAESGCGDPDRRRQRAEALEILSAGLSPDVIICDIDMPGMDGVEFVARVAESNLPCSIVIASGLESNVLRAVETIGEGHGLHVLAALQKPLTARRLGEVLRQYTRVNQARGNDVERAPFSSDDLRRAIGSGELTTRFGASLRRFSRAWRRRDSA